MPFRKARAAARSGPSVSGRDRCLRSRWPLPADMPAGAYFRGPAGKPARPRGSGARFGRPGRARGAVRAVGRGAAGAAATVQALALTAAEPPDVALDLARIDLAAGQVQV